MNVSTQSEVTALEQVPMQRSAVTLQQNSPAAIMLQALAQGTSLDQVEKMMDLQERWEKREAEKAFKEAFAAFRGHNITIPKSKFVDRGKAGSFQQAEYEDICKRISPALSEHGMSFRHDQKFGSRRWMTDGIENDSPWVFVTCYLEHKSGHHETLQLEGPPGDLSANTPTQNMQVTASYLKRQSLLAITGTATGGEDDENYSLDTHLADWLATVDASNDLDQLKRTRRDGGASFTKKKDVPGYAKFAAAASKREAQLKDQSHA